MEENTPTTNRWQRFRQRSRDEYQLVVRDVKSYREVGSYNLTPLNIYVALATAFFLVAVVVFLIIAYTPLRQYIPGYGDVVQRREMNEMSELVERMSERLVQQETQFSAMRRSLLGEVETAADHEEVDVQIDTTRLVPTPPSGAEMRLRREMALERVGQTSRSGSGLAPSPGSDDVPLAQLFLVAPLNGEISAGFKPAENHYGVDIIAPANTPIKAVREGVVIQSGFTSDNGNVIGIQHDNNLVTFYMHNSQLLKRIGDRVGAGEAIAIIGNTGELTTGPHLHFEIWHNGKVVDPVDYVRF